MPRPLDIYRSIISTWEGWAYLATVIDLGSRKVVGWALADHMRTELVSEALEAAFVSRRPPPGLVFHSDRGCQYTSGDYAELARSHGVVLSVGRKGECWDNAVAESFFATIKRELIDTRPWPTREGLRRAILDYIEGWFNTRRLHSSLGYRSPAQYEATIQSRLSPKRHNRHKQAVRRTEATPPHHRLNSHVRAHWPSLAGIDVRFRANFAYVEGRCQDGTTLKLCWLRYGGSADIWGFAIYRASHDDYEDSFLPTGTPAGTGEEALDCACGHYLNES